MILSRLGEQRRARLSEVELHTKYVVQAIWATAPGVKRGQPAKAVDAVRFLPKTTRRRVPSTSQVLRMFPPSDRTRVRG